MFSERIADRPIRVSGRRFQNALSKRDIFLHGILKYDLSKLLWWNFLEEPEIAIAANVQVLSYADNACGQSAIRHGVHSKRQSRIEDIVATRGGRGIFGNQPLQFIPIFFLPPGSRPRLRVRPWARLQIPTNLGIWKSITIVAEANVPIKIDIDGPIGLERYCQRHHDSRKQHASAKHLQNPRHADHPKQPSTGIKPAADY